MSDLSRYLRRFRRMVAPPGRPGLRAVPSDGPDDAHEELTPIIRAIDAVAAEADRIREDARIRAGETQDLARSQAETITEKARQSADAARAEAAANRSRESEEEIASIESEARAEAERILSVARQRLPRFVDVVVGRALQLDTPEG